MPNPFENYEAAIAALKSVRGRDALDYQHQAVLALTRASSLDYARAEYARYGLDKIRHHEDVMALGGRLFKDLYRAHSGKEGRDYALKSAETYEAAFKDTGGYYSGINAATMYLLGGVPEDMVRSRAVDVLKILPNREDLDSETLYYVEATRAECYLLLGDDDAAQSAMRRAWDHDPLNYTAHASTLNQFRMIAAHRDQDHPWIKTYTPPAAVHYAGHIFGVRGETDANVPTLSRSDIQALKDRISDTIQSQDIGFGYGALAAGADIIIAESLLEEGCQLHIALPVARDLFKTHSVAPFGADWAERFEDCMERAHTVRIATEFATWPDAFIDRCATLMSMGEAMRQAQALSVPSAQLLIWDGVEGEFGTSGYAQKWAQSGRAQHIITYPGTREASPHVADQTKYESIITLSHNGETMHFDSIEQAVEQALARRKEAATPSTQGLHCELMALGSDPTDLAERLLSLAVPGSILLSELAANHLMVDHSDRYASDFIGTLSSGERVFALREIG